MRSACAAGRLSRWRACAAMAPKNPVLISSLGYRKAVVRHCTEQLREIEGRLEQPSGPKWEQTFKNCEDLAGVGKLMLTLQKRTTELADADNSWLEELKELSTEKIDDRAIELSRRVKQRLQDLRAAVPYPMQPARLLGAAVLRPIPAADGGAGGNASAAAGRGRVIEHDECTGFRVLYADGDCEDLPLRELKVVLVSESAGDAAAECAGGKTAKASSTSTRSSSCTLAGFGAGGEQSVGGPSRGGLVLSAAEMREDVSVRFLFERMEQRHIASEGERDPAGGGSEGSGDATVPAGASGGGSRSELPAHLLEQKPLHEAQAPGKASKGGGQKSKDKSKPAAGRPTGQARKADMKLDAEPPAADGRVSPSTGSGSDLVPPRAAADAAETSANAQPAEHTESDLPPGWQCVVAGGKASFVGPDGVTQVSTAAKAHAWHRRQLQLSARFAQEQQSKRPRVAVPAPAESAPSASGDAASADMDTSTSSEPTQRPPAVAAPARTSIPEHGMSIIEMEAATSSPTNAGGKEPGKRLPRELRNLAIPDRTWNSAIPFYTTAAKTREQFSSNSETQAAAVAALEHHEQRKAELELDEDREEEEAAGDE